MQFAQKLEEVSCLRPSEEKHVQTVKSQITPSQKIELETGNRDKAASNVCSEYIWKRK